MSEESPKKEPPVGSPEEALAAVEIAAAEAPRAPDGAVVSPREETAITPREMSLDERLRIPELPGPETMRTGDSGAVREAGPGATREEGVGPPAFESVLPPDARGFFLDLPEAEKTTIRRLYEATLQEVVDRNLARFAVWRSTTFDEMRKGWYQQRENVSAGKRDQARHSVSNIDRDLKLAEEDGVLTPELKEKVSQERARAEAAAEKHDQELEDLKSNREHFERKQQAVFEAVSFKWNEKIKVNNEAFVIHTSNVEDIQSDLKNEQLQHEVIQTELERFSQRELGLTSESLRAIYKEKIGKLKEQKKEAAAAVKALTAELATEQSAIKFLEIRAKKLESFRDGVLGKQSKESAVRKGAESYRMSDLSGDREDAEQEIVEGLSLDGYVNAWNQTHRSLKIDVSYGGDAPVDRQTALGHMETYLRKKYPKRKKQYEAQLRAFRP